MYLDDKLIGQPAAALQLVAEEVMHAGDVVNQALMAVSRVVKKEDITSMEAVYEKVKIAEFLNGKINEYLANMFSAGVMTEEQASQTAGIMYVMGDIERIGIMCKQITESVQNKIDKKYKYSKDAMKDLEKSLKLIEEMYYQTMEVMTTGNRDNAKKIIKKKEKVLNQSINMRKAHVERVVKGKCEADMTAPFNALLQSIDRMANCCVNIADAALGEVDMKYFMIGEKAY